MFCPKCGNNLNESASFCASCGSAVTKGVQETTSQIAGQPAKETMVRKKNFAGIIAVVLGVAVILCTFLPWVYPRAGANLGSSLVALFGGDSYNLAGSYMAWQLNDVATVMSNYLAKVGGDENAQAFVWKGLGALALVFLSSAMIIWGSYRYFMDAKHETTWLWIGAVLVMVLVWQCEVVCEKYSLVLQLGQGAKYADVAAAACVVACIVSGVLNYVADKKRNGKSNA